jgi:alpha-1,6-mannosyltransferase
MSHSDDLSSRPGDGRLPGGAPRAGDGRAEAGADWQAGEERIRPRSGWRRGPVPGVARSAPPPGRAGRPRGWQATVARRSDTPAPAGALRAPTRTRRTGLASLAGVAGCGLAITLLLGSQSRVPDLLAKSPHSLVAAHGYLAMFGASFLLYLLALHLARAASGHPGTLLAIVGIGAVAMRLVLLPAPPTLTTDQFRYRWDGRVARHGINPYRYSPDEPSLRALRFPGWERINYPGTRTPYPPLAQLTFWLNAACLGDTILGLKLLFTAFDLATTALLLLLLRAVGRPPADVLIYAWHPLVVTETALSGHQDALGVFFFVAALWLVARAAQPVDPVPPVRTKPFSASTLWAGVALGLSITAKSLPVLYLPAMARRSRRSDQWPGPARSVGVNPGWMLALSACAVIAALYMPFLLMGAPLQGGAQAMAASWEANSSLYSGVYRLAAAALPGVPDVARLAARGFLGLLIAGVSLTRGDRRPTAQTQGQQASLAPLVRDLYVVTMVLFLASPVVMPWYLIWIVPLLVFYAAPAGYAFSALVVLSYLIPAGRWRWWQPWAEYLPVYALFAVELLRARSHASRPWAA